MDLVNGFSCGQDLMIYTQRVASRQDIEEDEWIYTLLAKTQRQVSQHVLRQRRRLLREPDGNDAGGGVWTSARRSAGALARGVLGGGGGGP